MITVQLPDGSARQFEHALTVHDVASAIGSGLAKATLAGVVDDKTVDSSHLIDHDCSLRLLTARDEEGLEIIRHSCAHLMAQAVKQLYPDTQATIGPVITDGFYYDFHRPEGFTPEDMQAIEKRMQALSKENLPIARHTMARDEAVAFFLDLGEEYKARIIADIPGDETLSLYQQGDFTDLCRGPHVPSTGHIKAFKLTRLSGAYWRGDAKNEMLQRVYGTCWADKKSLKTYLSRIEEAKKRDHRRWGKRLNLFHFQDEAPGMVFWHQHGWTIYRLVEQYIREVLNQNGYQEIRTPQLVDRSLWEKSGHWDKFGDMIFSTHSESRDYAVKPMNCPCHVQVYNQGLKSYRDLPLRLAEFGSCHRNEPSGTLHGLMRVRNFVQDDAHIFCTEAQVQQEVATFIALLFQVYHRFGFDKILIKLSTRPEQRVGSDALWDKAEKALADALGFLDLEYELQPGEGAFYGPKIEFTLLDSLDRQWQCGTIQVDFSMPQRLDAHYISEQGDKETPVMLHRAILGSLERFIGILLEEHSGAMPFWLAPLQTVLMGITDQQAPYLKDWGKRLKKEGFRCELDLRNEKVGFKIRDRAMQRIPFLLIAGPKEVENKNISVRDRDGNDLGVMDFDSLLTLFTDAASS